MLETLDYTIRIGSTPTILYFDLYLYSAYAAHCLYIHVYTELAPKWGKGEASNDFAAIGTPECQEQLASKQVIEWEKPASIETMLLLTSVMYSPLGIPHVG